MTDEERLGRWLVEHRGQAEWHWLRKGEENFFVGTAPVDCVLVSLRGWYPDGKEYPWASVIWSKEPNGTALLLAWLQVAEKLDKAAVVNSTTTEG
jgi:hypothetical protein